jgi:hypothetical protein
MREREGGRKRGREGEILRLARQGEKSRQMFWRRWFMLGCASFSFPEAFDS